MRFFIPRHLRFLKYTLRLWEKLDIRFRGMQQEVTRGWAWMRISRQPMNNKSVGTVGQKEMTDLPLCWNTLVVWKSHFLSNFWTSIHCIFSFMVLPDGASFLNVSPCSYVSTWQRKSRHLYIYGTWPSWPSWVKTWRVPFGRTKTICKLFVFTWGYQKNNFSTVSTFVFFLEWARKQKEVQQFCNQKKRSKNKVFVFFHRSHVSYSRQSPALPPKARSRGRPPLGLAAARCEGAQSPTAHSGSQVGWPLRAQQGHRASGWAGGVFSC